MVTLYKYEVDGRMDEIHMYFRFDRVKSSILDLQECDAGGEEEDVFEAAERERGRRGDRGGGRRPHGRQEEQEEEEKGKGEQLH